MSRLTCLIVGLVCAVATATAQQSWTAKSPDGRIGVTVEQEGKRLYYNVSLNNRQILQRSPLGVVLKKQSGDVEQVVARTVGPGTTSYSLPLGKTASVKKAFNELQLRMETEVGDGMEVVFRLTNGGVAYAYRFDKPQTIEGELSGFAFPKATSAFLTPLAKAKSGWCETNPSYEDHYHIGCAVDSQSDYREGWVYPALFEVKNVGWVLLSESGTDADYVATHLSEAKSGLFKVEFPPADHNLPTDPAYAVQHRTSQTPWRIMVIGKSLNAIVETTLPDDFVTPQYAAEATYRPGLASWSWLVYDDGHTTYEGTKEFIDMAAALRLPYCLIDALWDVQIGRDKVEELARYAQSKGVDILLWYNSNGNWNAAPQTPKNLMNTKDVRRSELAWLQKIGVKGIKVDFFGGDKQASMQLYEDILQDANDFGIAVTFHGCTLPRGWSRMFPNFVTAEAVMGQEFCKWDQQNENLRPQHCTVLPFTRNAVGPMDFTPVVLNEFLGNEDGKGARRTTTAAFELALPVILQSPITHLGIVPKNLDEYPSYVWDYISNLPTVWAQTRLLSGYPGKDVVVAREKDGAWYVAGINGENRAKDLTVDLSLLPKGKSFQLLTTDSANLNKVKEQIVGRENGSLKVHLASHDGFVLICR